MRSISLPSNLFPFKRHLHVVARLERLICVGCTCKRSHGERFKISEAAAKIETKLQRLEETNQREVFCLFL